MKQRYKKVYSLDHQAGYRNYTVRDLIDLKGKKKLTQIAKDNGFYDQSSFTQHFRKQMKITPLKYRKQRGFS